MLKRLLILLILGAAGYFAYQYYLSRVPGKVSMSASFSNRVEIVQQQAKAENFLNVLGATTTNLFTQGKDLLNNATGGQAEPVINKAVSDLQERVKDLPEEQYKKVKYEFCRDVFPASPEPAGEGGPNSTSTPTEGSE